MVSDIILMMINTIFLTVKIMKKVFVRGVRVYHQYKLHFELASVL